MSGSFGRFSWPTALMTAVAVSFVAGAQADRPLRRVVVPHRCAHFGAEADVLDDAVLPRGVLEVALEFGLTGEELGPVVVGREGVAVEVVADVDAAAGVAVLEPGAAGGRVLLDDRVRDAGVAEADAGEDARHAGADHHDVRCGFHVVVDRRAPVAVALVGSVEFQFLEDQRHVLGCHRFRDEELHHAVHRLR